MAAGASKWVVDEPRAEGIPANHMGQINNMVWEAELGNYAPNLNFVGMEHIPHW